MARPGSQLPSLTSPFTPAPRRWRQSYILASEKSSSVPSSPSSSITGTVPSPPSAAPTTKSPALSEDANDEPADDNDNDDNSNDDDDDYSDNYSDDNDGTGKVRWNPDVLLFARRLEKAERKYGSLAIANLDRPVSNTFASSAKHV